MKSNTTGDDNQMPKPVVHLICNAHLDPVWQWQWEEGCAEALSTFRNAVQLLNQHKLLIFNHNESVLYRWIMKYDKNLFKEIQRLVKAGRWWISGGWYLQPDVNLPAAESLIRHIAEGRRFFKKYFNAEPQVAYNFDSFGHSGGLPQILLQSGYKMYIHLRPQQPELDLPSDLYRWQGVDGSEILSYRIAVGLYHTEYENLTRRLKEGVELALTLQRDVPVFWGIGNHGGGASREDLKSIDEFCAAESRVKIIHSTPDRFYKAIKSQAKDAPVVKGDLQRIFSGCYTSLSRLKRAAQKSAAALIQTESLRTASWWLYGHDYPETELDETWRDQLFNDFHDILPGSCIEPAEKDALDLYGRVSESLRRMNLEAALTFNQGKLLQSYLPITVLNNHPTHSRMPVEVECMISHRPKWSGRWHLKLYDEKGKKIRCQEEQPEALLPFNGWRRKLCFMATLPSMGAIHFTTEAVRGKKRQKKGHSAVKFKINPKNGLIDQLTTGDIKNYLTGSLLKPIVMEDKADSWGTDHWRYRKIVGLFQVDPKSIGIIEEGPVRTIFQSIYYYNNSKIILNTLAYAEWPVLEFRIRIHWHEEQKRLKLSIPTILKNKTLLCEIPGGIIERPADGEEHVHSRWFILHGQFKNKGIAIAVINNGQNGLDYKNGEVRLSVLRSAAYCHEQGFTLQKYPARKYMDQGVHEIRLYVMIGKFQEVLKSIATLADWCSTPPLVYAHLPIGSLTQTRSTRNISSLLDIRQKNIRLLACKRSWDGKSLILRLQESTGKPVKGEINLHHPSDKISLDFQALEIKTIRIESSGRWQEVNLLWEK
jgi:alpha-mannosidase